MKVLVTRLKISDGRFIYMDGKVIDAMQLSDAVAEKNQYMSEHHMDRINVVSGHEVVDIIESSVMCLYDTKSKGTIITKRSAVKRLYKAMCTEVLNDTGRGLDITSRLEQIYDTYHISFMSAERLADMCGYCKCSVCKKWTYSPTTIEGINYCNDCLAGQGFISCSRCGRYHKPVAGLDEEWLLPDESDLCRTCFDNIKECYTTRNDYGFKPHAIFKNCHNKASHETTGQSRYFGLELELYHDRDLDIKCSSPCEECELHYNYDSDDCCCGENWDCERYSDYIDDNNQWCNEVMVALSDKWPRTLYGKYDGSIGGDGIEIVSHPMTAKYACRVYNREFINILKNHGMYANDGAGLHIHVNRTSLAKNSVAKLTVLSEVLQDDITRVACRDQNDIDDWSQFTDYVERWQRYHDGSDIQSLYATVYESLSGQGRYKVVNNSNSATVEFRVFASTTDYLLIRAYIGLVDAMCNYANHNTMDNVLNCTFSDLKEYTGIREFEQILL